ncbi:MAG TPA: hypothetical protein VN954_11870 [Ktedonobacteraceae bacterium]|nr:hypothetical protein [Ktedonobacteraceae bacterium]
MLDEEKVESIMNRVHARKVQAHAANPKGVTAILDDYLNQRALKVYSQTSALGFVTGIRSMSSLALLGRTSDKSREGMQLLTQWLPLVAALGEAVADKLPVIPSRTSPGPFIGRLVIGGVSALILCRREQVPPIPGVVIGVVGAGTGAFASHYIRTRLAKVTKIPDPVLGILEDALVSGLGMLAVRKHH